VTLQTLLDNIRRQQVGVEERALVSLEEFFDGNEDPASIGCNLLDHPGPQTFYRILKRIRERPEVKTVLVGITEVLGEDEWPFSDCVFLTARVDAAQVQQWAEGLQAEPVEEGWIGENSQAAPVDDAGFRKFTLWWD
jgi:hypothetical protein